MNQTKYGQTKLSVIAVRAAAKHSSEMVTQLLYNESYTILEEQSEWLYIQCLHDGYEGWIPQNQVHYISEELFDRPFQSYSSNLIDWEEGLEQRVFLGSPLYQLPEAAALTKTEQVCQAALKYLRTPYLWGGRSPLGIDCSGLMQMAFRMGGRMLPRDAYQQATVGRLIGWGERKKGDMAFFANKQGKISHVGLVWAENAILHASAWVRIDRLTEAGIFHKNEQTHHLSHLQRLF